AHRQTRTGNRIHSPGRVRRSHAPNDSDAQEGSTGEQTLKLGVKITVRRNMNTDVTMKTNGSSIWPYVIVGSAVGGAIGYLLTTESGRKIRRSVAHPDELADDLEQAREFIENKARTVTERVHGILNKAKLGIEEGERAYR